MQNQDFLMKIYMHVESGFHDEDIHACRYSKFRVELESRAAQRAGKIYMD